MKVLSVVCARAGSKGLRNKCIQKIGGKMVAEHAIEYSLRLGKDVETIVSTDIPELIGYCTACNVKVIKRDAGLCDDSCRIDDALIDALERSDVRYEYCSLVYGNIPTRYPSLFTAALSFLDGNPEFDAVISMQKTEKFHPDWMFDLNHDELPKLKESHYRRQGLQPKMIHDGHTLLFRAGPFIERYKKSGGIASAYRYASFGTRIKPMLNDEMVVDIDTEKDLVLAEAFLVYKSKACGKGDGDA